MLRLPAMIWYTPKTIMITPASCWISRVMFIARPESIFTRSSRRLRVPMVCSHWYWRSLSALLTLTASRPASVSIRLDWRSAPRAMVRSMVATSGFCNA
ncbi:hypothetical protein D3C72_1548480 [compost metagenome]